MRIELDVRWRGNCILAVEDNAVNQFLLEHTLGELGIPFHIAGDGLEAVEAFRLLDPMLVLMDISMPNMDGLTATGVIRGIEAQKGDGRRTPIIALTAHALSEDRQRCLDAGMDDYATKPISPAKVNETILHWLARTSPSKAAV